MSDVQEYPTGPGDYLPDVITGATSRSRRLGQPVRFTFNDATVTVQPTSTAEQIRDEIDAQWKAQAEAYRNSPEGKAAAIREAEHVSRLQGLHDDLMARLVDAVGNQAALIDWLEQYSDPADDMRVQGRDFPRVATTIKAAGYVSADALGLPSEAYAEPDVLARYLIGQAISQMEEGMPPHPGMMSMFASEYRKLLDPA